jgi:glycerol kinase
MNGEYSINTLLLELGCFNKRETKLTYGTGNLLLINTGEKPIESRFSILTTIAYSLSENEINYAIEGPISTNGFN